MKQIKNIFNKNKKYLKIKDKKNKVKKNKVIANIVTKIVLYYRNYQNITKKSKKKDKLIITIQNNFIQKKHLQKKLIK